jgi:hypothetical protein
MSVRFTSYANQAVDAIEADLAVTLDLAAGELRDDMNSALLERAYPPASAPGTTPHYRTRRLGNSIATRESGKLSRDAGTSVFYGKYLQDGTRNKDGSVKMAPRPFLTLSVNRMQPRLVQIMTAPIGGGAKVTFGP